ncbi:translation machinery-associated protein 16 isoform X2 [Hydra vulgaris]|uniref:Translation machinery-associated protein 16 isoform X2 n=1 Tax=Hydra vulgaris TaxID=6087 RepID=A0ABM4BRT9_HYDVU
MPKAEKIKKGKSNKEIHPNSRKASQISKSIHKQEKKQKQKEHLNERQKALREKLFWFKCEIEPVKDKYSLIEVSELILKYINRFEKRIDEIEKLNKLNEELGRHGQAHSAEYSALKLVREKETNLINDGCFEAPDITNRVVVKVLRDWSGELKDLPKIKLKCFKKMSTNCEDNILQQNSREL